ncbi:hypothetical protein HanOQP8_Chr05g0186151 [Helianthus annuus]|nr:hypothetical protein HanOQP8_Chr05g0186151 [Helianthus annuus]
MLDLLNIRFLKVEHKVDVIVHFFIFFRVVLLQFLSCFLQQIAAIFMQFLTACYIHIVILDSLVCYV